ncbi:MULTISPECIES: sensor histidine kinase [Parabacteroides]|uniref:sensor histidine kinase n=1 Tax=Parabacteroides leei TaxID=2939491 RepID=UPI00189BD90C|nr:MULTISPECIES: sensor histidine kinase [Parabacteroides]MCL3852391.1 sensor histidine kinase [Parabacteroides leei]
MNTAGTTPTHVSPPFRGMGSLIHIVAWGILIGLPFFFTGRETQEITVESYIRSIIVPLSFMVVFYINYFFLVKHYLFSKHAWKFFLSNVILIATAMVLVHLLMHLLPPPEFHRMRPEKEWQEVIGFFFVNALLYGLVAGLSVAIKMTNGWYAVESARRELEKSRAEAELQNLKSQLNPHFLFNTLNNIYSLIAFSPERAQEAVHDLSRLLRYVLYESSQQLVGLEKELDFIRNYVELMRIRLPENVELKTEISAVRPDAEIAPLLFISLIENAFKHGVSNNKPSYIHLDIHQTGDLVVCYLRNSYFPKDAEQDKSGSGIGISNLRKRLALLYPNRHIFSCGIDGDSYYSMLELQLINEPKNESV